MSEPIGPLVAALRAKLGLTQQAVADRGGIDRQDVGRIESGERKGSTLKIRRGLAAGFGLTDADFEAYVSGAISIGVAMSRATREDPAEPAVDRSIAEDSPSDEISANDSSEALSRALSVEHVRGGYTDAEIARARKLARATHHHGLGPDEVNAMARRYLRAVRVAGATATDADIAAKLANPKAIGFIRDE